ncbi:hypothetical protein VP01_580g2 [Puccinia sorghi]|uniref:Uncharacterized protein n=1 Tax=Puccinia sorghi TaxID=27349 RepID=A0A0L6UI47_9BASI|nr:hypothetical protein VP01_580g2 [Puccinia sorghi]
MAAFIRSYNSALLHRPLRTQIVTSLILFGGGDVIAQQAIERKGKQHEVRPTFSLQSRLFVPFFHAAFQVWVVCEENLPAWARTARLAGYGGFVFAPLGTRWFKTLDFIQLKSRGLSDHLFKAQYRSTCGGPDHAGLFLHHDELSVRSFFLHDFRPLLLLQKVYTSPNLSPSGFTNVAKATISSKQKKDFERNGALPFTRTGLVSDSLDHQPNLLSWLFIPLQAINFGLVPSHLRLLVINGASLFWSKSIRLFKTANSYLSYANASSLPIVGKIIEQADNKFESS